MSTSEGLMKVKALARTGDWEYVGNTEYESGKEKFQKWRDSNKFEREHSIVDKCVCGYPIKHHYYIYSKKENRVRVVGNDCVKKFVPTGKSNTCDKCGQPHRNRVVNRCNECRKTMCDRCNRSMSDNGYLRCYSCKYY